MSAIVVAGDTSGSITLQAPAVAGSGTVLTLPTTSGTLVSSGAIPAAGSTTQVQYNSGGSFAGSANLTYNGTILNSTVPIVGGATGGNGFVLNSSGSNYGFISNNTTGVWSLGYGTTIGTLGTSVLSWNSSNQVGVGTTSPTTYLTVVNPTGLPTSTAANAAAVFKGNSGVGNGGAIGFDYNSTATYYPAGIGYNINDNSGYTNGALVFSTRSATTDSAASERGRFTYDGYFLVGTTNTASNAGNGTKITNSGQVLVVNNGGNDGFDYYNSNAGAFRFYVNAAGTISATNTSINGISDVRLKENIRDLDDGLEKVLALKPRKFDWKEGKGADIKNARGFIAQEFETVFPDLIDEWKDPAPEGEDPYKSVRQDLIPTLVKAIQELNAKVTALEAQLGAK